MKNYKNSALRMAFGAFYAAAHGRRFTADEFKTFADLCALALPVKYRCSSAELRITANGMWNQSDPAEAQGRPSALTLAEFSELQEACGVPATYHIPLNCGCPDAMHCPDAIQKCEDETRHAEVPGTGYCRCTHVMYEGESHEDI